MCEKAPLRQFPDRTNIMKIGFAPVSVWFPPALKSNVPRNWPNPRDIIFPPEYLGTYALAWTTIFHKFYLVGGTSRFRKHSKLLQKELGQFTLSPARAFDLNTFWHHHACMKIVFLYLPSLPSWLKITCLIHQNIIVRLRRQNSDPLYQYLVVVLVYLRAGVWFFAPWLLWWKYAVFMQMIGETKKS
jgi:hypothetical protein